MLHGIRAQISALFRRRGFERDLDEELQSHLEMRIDEHLAAGMSRSEAERQARIAFGNVTATREASRGPWLAYRIDEFAQDTSYAVRWLARNPMFTLAVALTLALGVGANSAVFSLLDALLLQTPAINRPSEVHFIGEGAGSGVFAGRDRHTTLLSIPMFDALRERQETSTDLAALCSYITPIYQAGEQGPERLEARLVSGNFFHVLGVGARLGRVLEPSDDRIGTDAPAMVLSHSAWQGRFGGDPAIVGKTVTAGASDFQVIGVTPPGFRGVIHGRDTRPGSRWCITLASCEPNRAPNGPTLAGYECSAGLFRRSLWEQPRKS